MNKKIYGAILMIASIMMLSVVSGYSSSFFLKAGAGGGYDSNPFLEANASGLPFGKAFLNIHALLGSEKFKFLADGDLNFEYPGYVSLDGKAIVGVVTVPVPELFIRANAVYQNVMSLNQSIGSFAEVKADIGESMTLKAVHMFEYTIGETGLTNENSLANSVLLGGSIDLWDSHMMNINLRFQRNYYSELFNEAGTNLQTDLLGGDVEFVFQPGNVVTLHIGGGYAYNTANSTNLIVPASTNAIYLYNTSGLANVMLGADFDFSVSTALSVNFKADFAAITPISANVTYLSAVVKFVQYLSPVVKIEVPIIYRGRLSDSLDDYHQIKSEIDIIYMI